MAGIDVVSLPRLPFAFCGSPAAKTVMKPDELYVACKPQSPRKRSRERSTLVERCSVQENERCVVSPFLREIVLSEVNQQLREFDFLLDDQMRGMRSGLAEREKHQQRFLVRKFEFEAAKLLREKDEEIGKAVQLNCMLQDRIRALLIENEVWREQAQTNEAKANSLYTNLEQVLALMNEEASSIGAEAGEQQEQDDDDDDDDCVSSCGSSNVDFLKRPRLSNVGDRDDGTASRRCRKCEEREFSVLLMPCRHLCVCTVCGSCLRNCPVCSSLINASVHVNMT